MRPTKTDPYQWGLEGTERSRDGERSRKKSAHLITLNVDLTASIFNSLLTIDSFEIQYIGE